MVLNHLSLIVLLFNSLLTLVLATIYSRGFPHPHCSPQIRFDPFYLAHPTDCRKFYECDLGLAYEFQCPSEMHFNIYTNGCDTPENAFCRYDHWKINQRTSQQPKTTTAPSELKVLSTTKKSLDKQLTFQDSNSINRILANFSNHISHHIQKPSRPNGASTSSSRKYYWSKSTKPDNFKEKTRKDVLVHNIFFPLSTAKQSPTDQKTTAALTKHHHLIASTRPRYETVSRTTRLITSIYQKRNNLHLKHKNTAPETERTTTSISISRSDIADLKKMVFFGPIRNNGTIGENSVLNKLPVNQRKDWTKTNLPLKWKKQ